MNSKQDKTAGSILSKKGSLGFLFLLAAAAVKICIDTFPKFTEPMIHAILG